MVYLVLYTSILFAFLEMNGGFDFRNSLYT